jgi:hypothetical protein
MDPWRDQFIRLQLRQWYLWGWVEYDDIFAADTRHRTEFCFEILRSRLPDGKVWLGFRPTPRFNAVDSGCLRPIDPATGRSGGFVGDPGSAPS